MCLKYIYDPQICFRIEERELKQTKQIIIII